MSASALAVAKELVEVAAANGNPLTNMKLQKLLYFGHALSLTLLNKPLFTEKIEPWTYGPVVPDVYHSYKIYGPNIITRNDYFSSYQIPQAEREWMLPVINKTWELFGKYSAVALSEYSHKIGAPWERAISEKNPIISDESIKNYYSNIFKKT